MALTSRWRQAGDGWQDAGDGATGAHCLEAMRRPEGKTIYCGQAWKRPKIRAFFVHPDFARQGIGSRILEACERAATEAGFTAFEMGATLTGEKLYRERGYSAVERIAAPLSNGAFLPIIRMIKQA